jgi:hypothetical protein
MGCDDAPQQRSRLDAAPARDDHDDNYPAAGDNYLVRGDDHGGAGSGRCRIENGRIWPGDDRQK